MSLIDLGGPEGGRYWRVTTGQDIDHPDARAAAIHARVTGSVGCTYNDVTVERAEAPVKFNVVVSDVEGNVLFLEQVEVEGVLKTPLGARAAILDIADSIRGGLL